MSMFNQTPRPPRPPRPPRAQSAALRGRSQAARRNKQTAGSEPARGRGPIGSIDDYRSGDTQPAPMPGIDFIESITGGRNTRPVPMPDDRGKRLSESARQTDLPRVNKSVTDDEYNFYVQNVDRPFNTPDINQKVSDIVRRLENEKRFVTQYIDRPYLDPTEQDIANRAMVSAILSRMDRLGG